MSDRGRSARSRAGTAASVLALGLLLWALSEEAFWSAPRPGDGPLPVLGAIGAYTVLGVLLSALVRWARARTAAAVLVVGAAYGWLVEGVAATTLYGTAEIPVAATIAWTALAWHMPVVVLVGWWLLPRVLARGARPTAALAVGAGAAWGAWAAGWGPASGSAVAFLGFAAAVTALVAGSHLVLAVAPPSTGRVLPIVCGALAALWFAAVVVPAVPWAPLLLLPLLALAAAAAAVTRDGAPVPAPTAPRAPALLALVLLTPVVAAVVRTACLALPAAVPLQLLAAALLGVAGTAAFVAACVVQLRRRRVPPRAADRVRTAS